MTTPRILRAALAASLTALGLAGAASAKSLTPASPQPQSVAPGLNVAYNYPQDVKSLSQARQQVKRANPGPPLVGMDYPDTALGERALTSNAAEYVSAKIDGYLKFDQPGTWRLEFHSNDGLEVKLGGVDIYRKDGRFPCGTDGWVDVQVPEAGWYPVEAVYFQRMSTSCLMLRWEKPDGTREWTPQSAWGR